MTYLATGASFLTWPLKLFLTPFYRFLLLHQHDLSKVTIVISFGALNW